jgi:hypothetical protein
MRRIPVWMWVIAALIVVKSIFSVIAALDDPAPGATATVPSHPAAVTASPGTPH